jgi:hypothetical protein
MTTDLVPFGKHKGQPLTVLAQDRDYCDWLLQQSWFMQRFPELHTIVINNFGEPNETPEHNRLQLRFLDPVFVAKCSRAILDTFKPKDVDRAGWFLPMPTPEFEVEGIDVFWNIQSWDCAPKREVSEVLTSLATAYEAEFDMIAKAFTHQSFQEFVITRSRDSKVTPWQYATEKLTEWVGYGVVGNGAHAQAIRDAENEVRTIEREEENAIHKLPSSYDYMQKAQKRVTGRTLFSDREADATREREQDIQRIKERFAKRLADARAAVQQAKNAHKQAGLDAVAALQARWEADKPFFVTRMTTQVICPTPKKLPDYRNTDFTIPFAVECKPSLGDDYPAVLRFLKSLIGQQVHTINRCHKAVVIDQFSAQGGTLAQVKTFFGQAKILLLTVEEIEATEPLNNCEFAHFATCNVDKWLNEKARTS